MSSGQLLLGCRVSSQHEVHLRAMELEIDQQLRDVENRARQEVYFFSSHHDPISSCTISFLSSPCVGAREGSESSKRVREMVVC